MKRLIIYTLLFLITSIASVKAQSFVPTWDFTCMGCVPAGYYIVSGSPAISSPVGLGGNPQTPWQAVMPNPPSFMNGDQVEIEDVKKKTFLTLKHNNFVNSNHQDVARVLISKFVPGKPYNFHFGVLFSKIAATNSAKSLTVTITTTDLVPQVVKTLTIGNLGENYWSTNTLNFTPNTSALFFTFSAQANSNTLGYVNLDIPQYAFDCVIPTAQVQLFHSNSTTRYPCGRIGLDILEKSTTPPNGTLIWKKGPDNVNEDLASNLTEAAPVGHYYAFYRDQTMPTCYNVQTSTAKAVLSYVETQVLLKKTLIENECPKSTASLEEGVFDLANQLLSSEEEIRWFKNNTHQGVPENASAISSSGDYYAFLYNKVNNCYSTNLSTSKVTVSIKQCCAAGTAQVSLSRSNAVNTCPATTVNLNNTNVTNQPPFTSVAWFKDASHTVAVADPTKAGAGTYYAFFKDNAMGCFNTDMSTTTLKVTINACAPGKVDLNLKVFLQGATTVKNGVATMRNDLQVYPTGPTTFGLLPTQDPYGGGAVYPQINSAGEIYIVDWVKVEIRGMADPSQVLESQSLLLLTDGSVVNIDGSLPKFNSQFGGARIAVKHRNHLPVLGLGIVSFNAGGTVNYDFTGDLSKAYNVGAPPQMVLTNGVWCMISGDIQQDFTVDNADLSNERTSFNNGDFDAYKQEDLNLDGIVDNVDISFFKTSFNKGYFSTLINY